jgi:hypothetical protein
MQHHKSLKIMQLFLKSALVLVALFAVILGYIREVPYFSNTFDIQHLFFRSLFVGLFVGVSLGLLAIKFVTDKADRTPVLVLSILTCVIVFPLLGIMTNHALAKNDPLSTKVLFEKEEPLRTSRFGVAKNSTVTVDAFYVYFTKDYKTERIRSKTQSFRTVEAGQEIELPIKKGFWGFDFFPTF